MRHIYLAVVILSLFVVTGCMTTPVAPVKHQLEILTTPSDELSKIEVITSDEPQYELPKSPYLKPSGLTSLTHDGVAIVKIFSGLSVSDFTNIYNDFLYLQYETDIRTVQVILNSPGGDAFSGMAIADTLLRFQKKGFEITAYGSGIIASAAVPVFSVCKKRIAAPGTMFMVHEAALWKWPGRETASDIRSQNELMREIQARYLSYLPNGVHSDERWVELMKMSTWFNAEKALDWGVATHIE